VNGRSRLAHHGGFESLNAGASNNLSASLASILLEGKVHILKMRRVEGAGAKKSGLFTDISDDLDVPVGKARQVHGLKALFDGRVASPVIGRDAATRAVAAVGDVMGLDALTKKFLGVMAQGRRLSQLGAAIRAFEMLLSNHKGESRAEVTSAHPLAKTQVTALEKALKARVGRDVAVDLKVDPTVLGGLVVKIGSQMIDSSIRTRLNSLAQAMKG